MNEENSLVFMDIRIGEESVGRIIIELFAKAAPKTTANFRSLCIGDQLSRQTGRPLHYKGTIFHKIVRSVFVQGGDVTHFDGSGGESVCDEPFDGENQAMKHVAPGLLSTVISRGKCNSQFIITLGDCPQLDGSNFVFGRIIKGLACVLQMGEIKLEDDRPSLLCMVEDSGILSWGSPWNYVDCDETEDNYPPDPKDLEPITLKKADMMNILTVIRKSGNHFFAKSEFMAADRKYRKALRYIDLFVSGVSRSSRTESEKKEVLEALERHKKTCLINSSASALKKGSFREALCICDEILKNEKDNPKVYFWRGKALLNLNDYEGALMDQRKALSLAPTDKCIKKEIKIINALIKNYLVKEKKVFAKMFCNFKLTPS